MLDAKVEVHGRVAEVRALKTKAGDVFRHTMTVNCEGFACECVSETGKEFVEAANDIGAIVRVRGTLGPAYRGGLEVVAEDVHVYKKQEDFYAERLKAMQKASAA